MNHPLVDEFKQGHCEWCCEDTTVYVDNGRCEECDIEVFHCCICKRDQHRESLCRHLFQEDYDEWSGSGAGTPSDAVKSAFFRLLSFMPPAFGADLRTAIRSGRFHTWMIAPLIGSGGCLSMYGMPDQSNKILRHNWGDLIVELGGGKYADTLADAYHWLASLYNEATPAANRITIKWLNEWLTRVDG